VRVTVLYFASLRDALACADEALELELDRPLLSDLVASLVAKHPAIEARLKTLRFAVNEQFSDLDTPLAAGDVIALIPPVSGG
jgi:molybdopterin converting factor subunit 1